MFDDLKQQNNQAGAAPQQSTPPQNPAQPVTSAPVMADMFDSVDPVAQSNLGSMAKPSAVQSGKIKPVSNTSYTAPSQSGEALDPMMFTEAPSNKINKIIIILVVVLLVVALGFGAYYFFIVRGKLSLPSNNQNTNQENNLNNVNTEANTNEVNMTDSDADGLTDDEELQYNTNTVLADTDGDDLSDREEIKTYTTDPLVMDTDNDGLNDGEEVKVWNTDPKNSDSDNDSYPDGTEVKNGYSPTGPGKLSTSTTPVNTGETENPQFSAAVLWGIQLVAPIGQCYQSSKTSTLSNYLAGADICSPKINQNWPVAPDAYPKVCVLDKVIQDNTWSIGLQSNSPDTLPNLICNQNGCQAAALADYPSGKVCP